ncbi:hypothetical protein [Nocardia sp. NPDC052566]|uniref:hypothetical protein n=1 Tax=Nocardia sp. NPDC052566 TaxID=3364330 RepID=UPI0037CC8690
MTAVYLTYLLLRVAWRHPNVVVLAIVAASSLVPVVLLETAGAPQLLAATPTLAVLTFVGWCLAVAIHDQLTQLRQPTPAPTKDHPGKDGWWTAPLLDSAPLSQADHAEFEAMIRHILSDN